MAVFLTTIHPPASPKGTEPGNSKMTEGDVLPSCDITATQDHEAPKNVNETSLPNDGKPNGESMPPNLDSFISGKCLPGLMDVYDGPDGILSRTTNQHPLSDGRATWRRFLNQHSVRFVRVYPPCTPANEDNNSVVRNSHTTTGQLNLRRSKRLGEGNHSIVVFAPLTLPSTAGTSSMHGAVAVKIARPGEREMLEDEGKIYNAFPRKLQEGCSQTPIPPVVPKFYGYYVPSLAEFDGKAYDELNDEEKDHVRCMINRISPILLLEQCGEQFSGTVGGADREKIAALLSHLHDANFVQGSMYKRNIVMQPGPLTLPQTQRSLREPSFRIIDFGRGKCCNPKVNYVNKEDWVDEAEHERNKVVEWTLR